MWNILRNGGWELPCSPSRKEGRVCCRPWWHWLVSYSSTMNTLCCICSTVNGSNKATYLVNDMQTLMGFLNSAKIPIIAVTILAIKCDLEENRIRWYSNKTLWHRHTPSYSSYGWIFLEPQGIPLPHNVTPVKLQSSTCSRHWYQWYILSIFCYWSRLLWFHLHVNWIRLPIYECFQGGYEGCQRR